jgi:hypothetical protein
MPTLREIVGQAYNGSGLIEPAGAIQDLSSLDYCIKDALLRIGYRENIERIGDDPGLPFEMVQSFPG